MADREPVIRKRVILRSSRDLEPDHGIADQDGTVLGAEPLPYEARPVRPTFKSVKAGAASLSELSPADMASLNYLLAEWQSEYQEWKVAESRIKKIGELIVTTISSENRGLIRDVDYVPWQVLKALAEAFAPSSMS
ncbi:hypothetical protein MMC22_001930 [Lobaria immixta]|nr:hypothetical protein [Lobaria immixta]